jgi:hypothetical protein
MRDIGRGRGELWKVLGEEVRMGTGSNYSCGVAGTGI